MVCAAARTIGGRSGRLRYRPGMHGHAPFARLHAQARRAVAASIRGAGGQSATDGHGVPSSGRGQSVLWGAMANPVPTPGLPLTPVFRPRSGRGCLHALEQTIFSVTVISTLAAGPTLIFATRWSRRSRCSGLPFRPCHCRSVPPPPTTTTLRQGGSRQRLRRSPAIRSGQRPAPCLRSARRPCDPG